MPQDVARRLSLSSRRMEADRNRRLAAVKTNREIRVVVIKQPQGLSSLALPLHPIVRNPHQNVNLDLPLTGEGTDHVKRVVTTLVVLLFGAFIAVGCAGRRTTSNSTTPV